MDLSKYGDMEQIIIKAFEKNEFEKKGVRETCRRLADKHGYSSDALKTTYVKMKRYGAFEMLFPERFKVHYVSFATRLKTSNIDKIDDLAKHTGKSKQLVINDLIEEAHDDVFWERI